jgi:hippurate hydrolase
MTMRDCLGLWIKSVRRTTARLGLAVVVSLALLTVPGVGAEKASPKELAAEATRTAADEIPSLETLYKHLHSNPELSLKEEQTSARMAKELKTLGFEVTEKVGGYGVVGVFKNGKGPTVMVRTDMDALPVLERTGLAYASRVRMKDKDGKESEVMHACGHDMHMACWVGAARTLIKLKDKWQGTLVFIAQPAEEIGSGARMMIADGVLTKFPRPDYAFALHCHGNVPYGHIAYSPGLALANVDTVDITILGKGGHGSAPHTTIDPVVLAAKVVIDLQQIVSRETNPLDPAVVTVGSIHGGTKHNIIPNDVKLQLTVRTTKDSTRKQVLEAITRITKAAAVGARAPEPKIVLSDVEFTPALYNDVPLAKKTTDMFREVLGADHVHEQPPVMGGEDFGRFGREKIPIFLWFLGTVPPERVAEAQKGGKPMPSLHSDLFHPTPEPSIKTGVLTLTMAVLNVMGK